MCDVRSVYTLHSELLDPCCRQRVLLRADKMVKVDPFRVTVAGKDSFGCVNMDDFLHALRAKLKPNPTASAALPTA